MWIAVFVLATFTVALMRKTSFAPEPPVDNSIFMDEPIRYGVIATVFWGVIGFLLGVFIAVQFAFPDLRPS